MAGHKGLVGSAIVRCLKNNGYDNIIERTRKELDLLEQNATEYFFKNEKPDLVIIAAAKVGGIFANSTQPAEFLYQNLMIQNNIIYYSHKCKEIIVFRISMHISKARKSTNCRK